jgi:hypothetical protein
VVKHAIGYRILDIFMMAAEVIPKNGIIAPAFGFFGLGDDSKLTPDEFSQGDSLPAGERFGAGLQLFGQKDGGAMHMHIYRDMDMAVKVRKLPVMV